MLEESKKRHLAKTLTWRIIATLTTFCLAFLFFNDDEKALQKASGVAGTEFVLKMILYYFHERIWYKSNFGLNDRKRKRS
jgi:uncharacterized membrane protein